MPTCFLQLLWNYKLNLTTDPKFESVAADVCRSTIPEVCHYRTAPIRAANFLRHRQWSSSMLPKIAKRFHWRRACCPFLARLRNVPPSSWARATWCPAWWTTGATSATTTANSTSPRWPPSSSATTASSAASWTAAVTTSTRCAAAASAPGRRWDRNFH